MKFRILLLLLISYTANAQRREHITDEKQIIKIGTNPKIALTGAYDYSDRGSYSQTLSWVTEFSSGNQFGIAFEYTELNPYFFTAGFIYNYNINVLNSSWVETRVGGELLYLQRGKAYRNAPVEFITGGINGIIDFNVSELIVIGLRANYKYRPDTIKIWDGQKTSWGGFLEIGFKFK